MRHRTRTLEALLVSLASSWLDAILSSDMTTSMTHDTNLFCMANRDSDQLSFTPSKRQIPILVFLVLLDWQTSLFRLL